MREDLVKVAVADVGNRERVQSVRNDGEGLGGYLHLLRPDGQRRLINLYVLAARPGQVHRLIVDRPCGVHDEGLSGGVVLVERPVNDGVRPSEHPLYGLVREALSVLPPVDGHGLVPANGAGCDGLAVVAISVGAHEAAVGEPGHVLGEVGHHIAPVHLPVHHHVHPHVLLHLDPVGGSLLLQLLKLLRRYIAPLLLGARPRDVVRLGIAPDCRGQ